MERHYSKAFNSAQLILYCGFIYWLSDQPSIAMPMYFPHQDKLLHAGAYFIMMVFVFNTFGHWINDRPLLIMSSLIFCSLYALSDEWHQSFVPGRDSDIADWFADMTGAVLCAYLYFRYWQQNDNAD